jgi:hypothetical protein
MSTTTILKPKTIHPLFLSREVVGSTNDAIRIYGNNRAGFAPLLDKAEMQKDMGRRIIVGTADFQELTGGKMARVGMYLIGAEGKPPISETTDKEAYKIPWFERFLLHKEAAKLINASIKEGRNDAVFVTVYRSDIEGYLFVDCGPSMGSPFHVALKFEDDSTTTQPLNGLLRVGYGQSIIL